MSIDHTDGTVFFNRCLMEDGGEILKDIIISAETGCVVKLKLKEFVNPVITAVESVSGNTIILKPTCLYGYPLKKRNVRLSDIEQIKRYRTYFNHPLFERIRFIKSNISSVRKNLRSFSKHPVGTLSSKSTS